ncbi:MAG: hypothetical protein V2J55_21780 [Candidatus Competibacteraceae bacterium]|nr:hypothetical protein [Candidatus Competibacteraceae bacterium]
MNYSLSQPSESLSRKILSPVPFKARFPAGRLKPPVGIMPGDVRSLPELHLFLEPDNASLPGINLKALPEWVETSIGDKELAEAIRAIVDTTVNYVEDCVRVHQVVGYRLDQAHGIIKETKV